MSKLTSVPPPQRDKASRMWAENAPNKTPVSTTTLGLAARTVTYNVSQSNSEDVSLE